MKNWDLVASDYENKVYSITKWKEKRNRILEAIYDGSNILILGSGSEIYLQKDILQNFPNCTIVCSDISKEMLSKSKRNFNSKNISFKQEDMMSISYTNEFDIVISTNSILMNSIHENSMVFDKIVESLKKDGKLIAYLPSFESIASIISSRIEINNYIKIDNSENLVHDSVDNTSQCFHTINTISKNTSSFNHINLSKVTCSESQEEFLHVKGLYGSILSDDECRSIWEFFLIAKK